MTYEKKIPTLGGLAIVRMELPAAIMPGDEFERLAGQLGDQFAALVNRATEIATGASIRELEGHPPCPGCGDR